MTVKKSILFLLLIMLMAFSFRIPAILNSQSFWFDEVVSLEIAKHKIVESWQYLKWENNPPVHYWFLHMWMAVCGAGEKTVRWSSVLFSILGVVAIFFLGKRISSARSGLIAALLFALSSYQIFLSMDARMYPMLVFFGIMSEIYFLKIVELERKKSDWILYVLFTILALHTHLTALFLIIIQHCYFWCRVFIFKEKKNNKNWWMSQAVIFAAFLPWLASFFERSMKSLDNGAWYFHTSGGGLFLIQMPRSFIFLGDQMPFLETFGLAIFVGLVFNAIFAVGHWQKSDFSFCLKLREDKMWIFPLIIFLVPLIIGFILQIWVAKYFVIASIGFYLLVGLGFDYLKIDKIFKLFLLLLVCLMLVPHSVNVIMKQGQHQWYNLAKFVEDKEKTGDLIFLPAFVYKLPFDHYYRGEMEVRGYMPQEIGDDLLLNAIKYNWFPIIDKFEMPDIGELVAGHSRVIVVYPVVSALIHKADLALNWFAENDWKLEEEKKFVGFIRPQVLIFVNPQERE